MLRLYNLAAVDREQQKTRSARATSGGLHVHITRGTDLGTSCFISRDVLSVADQTFGSHPR